MVLYFEVFVEGVLVLSLSVVFEVVSSCLVFVVVWIVIVLNFGSNLINFLGV